MNDKIKKTLYITGIVFFGTMAIYALIQCISGLYPFGNTLNLLWDEDIQYVDYFAFYKDVLLGKADIGYSFSKSLGGSLVALFGYYLVSPLNLLVVFFEQEQLPLFIFLITMLKMGLCSVSASVFMRRRFPDLSSSAVIGLSMGYGLMQYMMLQCSNIMWLDGVFFLPLLLLSMYYFIREKKKIGLFLSVMFSILINWYTGYMICLFAVCYFLYERLLLMEKWSGQEIKKLFLDGIQCGIVMLLGLGGSAVVFYPVFRGLLKGKSVWDPSIFTPRFYGSLWEVFRGFAEGSILETVSLYCGIIFFAFFLYYFLCRQVKIQEKVISFIAVLFMFVSCWFVPLECVWSGMREVKSYRFRYGFLVTFLVLYMAARGVQEYQKKNDRKKMGVIFLGIIAALVLSHIYWNYEIKTFWATLITLVLYLLIFMLIRERKVRIAAIAVVLAAELTVNGVLTFTYNYSWSPDVTAYQNYASQAKQQVDLIKEYDDSIFYRMDTVSKRDNASNACSSYLNDSLAYGYHGIAHYSSTFDDNISYMIYDMGYSSSRDLSIYTQPILTTDALLGIKYVLSREDLCGLQKIEELGTVNEKNVYFNPYALGLGMTVADTVFEYAESENPFEFQNQLFSNILGEQVELFKPVESVSDLENEVFSFKMSTRDAKNHLYGYAKSMCQDLGLFIDGTYRCNYEFWLGYRVFDVGMMDVEHLVEFRYYPGTEEELQAYFYYLDQDVFDEVLAKLGENPFEVETFSDGYVTGTYTTEDEGNLLLTIPYDAGWSVKVNGQAVEHKEGANALTVIPVEAGENRIEMEYQVPGQKSGIVISLISILLIGIWCWVEKRYHGKDDMIV